MGQITRDCPHCGTNRVAFNSFGEVNKPHESHTSTVAFYCGGCFGGIIAEIYWASSTKPHVYKGAIESFEHFRVNKTYPLPQDTKAPKNLPSNLENFYLQAANSLKSQNFDASSMMSRKVLEVAVKILDPEGGGNLFNRIEKLENENLITPDLKDWAHIIRDDGNVAAHEENPVTKEFAEEIHAFAEMFLMYTFTMPNMIKERRHDEQLEENEA